MAAAVVAVNAAAKSQLSFNGRRKSFEELLSDATRHLPSKEHWVMEGLLQKRVVQTEVQWYLRRVVLTDTHLCVTRKETDDIIEQLDLLEIEGLLTFSEAGEGYGRRGSGDADVIAGIVTQEEQKPAFVFKVKDASGGKRRYCFATQSHAETQRWIAAVKAAVKDAHQAEKRKHYGKWIISRFYKFYHHPRSQFVLALVIISNFAVAIAKAQLAPDGTGQFAENLEALDLCYTVFFIIELIINMIGSWFFAFWMDWWNLFDVIIVFISVLSIPLSNVKGFSLLRMMRVFRVVRLFQSLKSLRTIITALTKAIIPVANAFVVLAIITAIYAVVGVGLFYDVDPVAFGDFSSSLFTMFQVCTGDGWATAIARPMFVAYGDPPTHPKTSITMFFVSYILIVGTFLLNVVVAVLLDEFISAVQSGKAEARMAAQNQKKHNTALDPLLATFASCENSKDLSTRIKQVYQVLDGDDSGGLSFEEMREGLKTRLITEPVIYLAPENFDAITEQQTLCNAEGELDLRMFEVVMRKQLDLYAQRRASFEMVEAEHSQTTVAAILLILKQLMLTREEGETKRTQRLRRESLEKRLDQAPKIPGRSPGYRHRSSFLQRGSFKSGGSPHHESISDNGDHGSDNGDLLSGDDEEIAPPAHYNGRQRRSKGGGSPSYRSNSQDMSRLEDTVRDMQSRMDTMQNDVSTLVRVVREGFENQTRQNAIRRDHTINGSAANYNGIGVKLDDDKEIVLIAVQEVQKRLSTLESQVGSFEGLQRNVGTKVLGRVQGLEQKLEVVYKGITKLAKSGFSAAGSESDNGRHDQKTMNRTGSSPEAGSKDTKPAASAASAAGGTGRPRGGKSAGRGGLIAPPQALEISAMEQAYYDEKSQFVGAAATQLMVAGMEQKSGGGESTFSPRRERKSSMRTGKDGPLVTAELGFDTQTPRRDGNRAAGRPPFVVSGDRGPSEHAVRVSWACTPKGLPGMMAEPPIEMTCGGCRRCSDGYVGVGCLICGDKMALVASTDELGGATVGGLELMVTKAHRILRRYGFVDKVVDPSRFVDSPSGDGTHWYRCFIIAEDPVGKG